MRWRTSAAWRQMSSKIDALYPGKHYLDFAPGFEGGQVMPWSAFFVYLFIQWWANKYSDGGGKHIQRMSAARNETHSVAGTFMYSILYVALHLADHPHGPLCADRLRQAARPGAGLSAADEPILPNGVLGFCLVGLLSAFMSTVSTLFNLGPSYLVNDIYKAFLVKHATEKHYVLVSRLATGLVALAGMILSVYIESIADMWQFVLSFASGAGIVWILRWFWWRINAWSEFSSMICSAHRGHLPQAGAPRGILRQRPADHRRGRPPRSALLVTYLTPPVNDETLRDFYNQRAAGPMGLAPDRGEIRHRPHALPDPGVRELPPGHGPAVPDQLRRRHPAAALALAGAGEMVLGIVLALVLIRRIQTEPHSPSAQ